MSFIAHPYWSGLPLEVLLEAENVEGVELFNSSAERDNGRGDSSYMWDLTLEAGKRFSGFATDDCHYPGFDIGDAWTMVKAAERSETAFLDALRGGMTYASSGPVIHDVQLEGDAVEVHCSPARSVVLMSRYETGWSVRADSAAAKRTPGSSRETTPASSCGPDSSHRWPCRTGGWLSRAR